MAVTRVTTEEVERMYELFAKYNNYAAVGREMGRSPSTVAKYIKAAGLKPLRTAMAKHSLKRS